MFIFRLKMLGRIHIFLQTQLITGKIFKVIILYKLPRSHLTEKLKNMV